MATDEYQLTLYMGDQSFTAEATNIAAADTILFHIPFVPQTEGTQQAYFQLTLSDGTTITTSPVDVTVTKQIIDAIHSMQTATIPVAPAYNLRGQRVPEHRIGQQAGVVIIGRRKVLLR